MTELKRNGHELPVSVGSADACAALDRFSHDLASIATQVVDVFEQAERFPECSLLQASAASLHLFAQSQDQLAPARSLLERARQCEGNDRERRFNDLLFSWAEGNVERALAQIEVLLALYPQDLAAAKIAEYFFYLIGQAYHSRRFLRLMDAIADQHSRQPHFLAMRAFALELSGERDEAERVAEAALSLERATPWAHHCLAHVYGMRGDPEGGLRRLRCELGAWTQAGRAVYSHNAWHLAVMHIDRCEPEAALDLYREHVFGVDPGALNEQVDAISLLWRLELAGWPQEALWAPLAAHVEPRVGPWVSPFVAAHTTFALARAGLEDACTVALESAAALAKSGAPGRREVWAQVALPLLEASVAFARGEFALCCDRLAPIGLQIGRVGGSDAQDALFLQTWLVAAKRAGRMAEVERALALLVGERSRRTPLEAQW